MRKATFPLMGEYTNAFKMLVEGLGFEVILPPKTNQETIKAGVRHSSDMVCFPFKATLGNLIQALEMGADTIIVTGVSKNKNKKEGCRFCFYYHIQENILKRLGYKFQMIYLHWDAFSIITQFNKIYPKLGYVGSIKLIKRVYKEIKRIDAEVYNFKKKDINIGLVGEAYTLWEDSVNYNIIKKLESMDVGVHMSINLSWFLKHQIGLADEKKELHKDLEKYFPKRIGGHGFESLYNTLWYAKNGFDGVIHLLPLSCMPETIVEMPMDMISQDYNIPVYRFPIDENNFEAGFDTRLETFIKLLRRNKNEIYRN